MKESRLRFSKISFLRRTLLLLGCVLFSWSVVVPFYHCLSGPMVGGGCSVLLWSFTERALCSYGFDFPRETFTSQRWFFDCWFGGSYQDFLVSWPLLAIFVTQIVTLATGIISVFNAKRIAAAVPPAACLATTLFMVYQNILLSDYNFDVYSYQLGYWLTYPSLVLFIINFLLILALPQQKWRAPQKVIRSSPLMLLYFAVFYSAR